MQGGDGMNMQIDMAYHRDSHITPEQKLAQAIIWRAGINPYFVRDKYVAGKINVDTMKQVTRRRVAE